MAWTIEYDKRTLKEFRKLDRQMQRAILDYFDERISQLENPRSTGKPLAGGLTGLWRYRIGDYRAICKIEDKKLVILVVRISHRSTIYK